jgi:hypothetical protein
MTEPGQPTIVTHWLAAAAGQDGPS